MEMARAFLELYSFRITVRMLSQTSSACSGVAVRPVPGQTVRELYCYRVPSSTEWNPQLAHTAFLPNVMVDITDYAALKEAALLAYQTEARAYPHPRSAQYVRETDRSCGLQWGMGSSEAFMLLRKKG